MPPKAPFSERLISLPYRSLLQRSAGVLFWLRVSEGLAAWMLFAHWRGELGAASPVFVGFTQALFWLYIAVNAVAYLRYRSGKFGYRFLSLELVLNLGFLLAVAAGTGLLMSPALLLVFVKVATYGLVCGVPVGMAAAGFTGVALASFLAIAESLGVASAALESAYASPAHPQVAYFFVYGVGLVSFSWLLVQLGRREATTSAEQAQARHAAERERRALETTNALLRVNQALGQLASPADVIQKVVDVSAPLLEADICCAFLWNDAEQRYFGTAIAGVPDPEREKFLKLELVPTDVPDLEWARSLGHCVVVGSPVGATESSPNHRALLVPLKLEKQYFGVLQYVRRSERPFVQHHIRLADGIANQLALALERARLVEQSYRLLRAVESTEEGLLILDARARIRLANPAFARLLGYQWHEIAGRLATDFAVEPTEGWAEVFRCVANEQHWRGEIEARHRDGSVIPVRLHANVVVDEAGTAEGVVAILEDIRGEKELQEQLARSNRLAAAGELAAGLAHELNNALTAILGQISFARDRDGTDSLRVALDRIEEQAQQVARLTQNLLGFARPATPRLERVSLGALLRSSVALVAPECARRDIVLLCEDRTEGAAVLADPGQIQQVLVNLLTNATQALANVSGGRITVRGKVQGACGVVEVEDNGPGIDKEVLPRIFDPFFTTKPKGTGLGLSVSYAIARAHGGTLKVHTTSGRGTTFCLELPAATACAASALEGLAEREQIRRVLLVDDDDGVAAAIGGMLEREGIFVERARSGREAMDQCERATWDAVLLDVRLPDLSGPEVYAWLQQKRPGLARRVVFVTGGLWRSPNASWQNPLPPQPTLAKPCSAEQLRAVLVSLHQMRDAA